MSERTWAQRKADNNDGMDPDWRPTFDPPKPQQFIPQEDYDLLHLHAKGLENLLTASKNEIKDRWDPLVKKLRSESAQFQHDMMGRHEKFVMAMSKAKELQTENEKLRAAQDEHMKLIDELRGCLAKRVKAELAESPKKLLEALTDSRNLTISADGTTLKCTCERKPCHELHLSAGDKVIVVSYVHREQYEQALTSLRMKI